LNYQLFQFSQRLMPYLNFVYTRFCIPFGVSHVFCGAHLGLRCGYAASFAANTTLVVSQW